MANISNALEWISQESVIQAENVEEAIITKIDELAENPEKYTPDKFKKSNNGSYCSFETHSFRISYHNTEKAIRILRIRYVKQKPKEF